MPAGTQTAPYRSIDKQVHISVQRYFEISLLLMLGTGFLTLASTGRLDAVSIGLFSAALGAKLWSYVRGESGYRLSPRAVTRLSVLYMFFFLLDFFLLAGGPGPLDRMLAATVHLILFITVIKVFSARRYRDYGYLAALSFLMMLVGAVLTVSASYLIGLTLYVLFAISMFISYDVKRGIEMARQAPKGPYADPARNRVEIENSLGMTALGLAMGIAVAGSVLFFVIPRYHTSYFSNFALQAQNVTGFSESVNLGDIGAIKRSNLVVMRVKIAGGPRKFQGIRWRGIGLTSFTGTAWYNENTSQRRMMAVSPGRFVFPLQDGWQRRPEFLLRYQVLLSSISTDVVFAAAQPREIFGNFPALGIDETGSLHDPQHLGAPIGYTVVSNVALPSPDLLRRAGQNYSQEIRGRYLSLPKPDLELAALATRIAKPASNSYDRALAVQNYLRSNYGYTLDPPGIEPADPVDSFLFKSRKGYCAYFAAAMTLMLRTLNVPARIVNGFQTGTYNPIGQDFVVRARDAHSWVEAYFPGYGWIPFDPTPAGPSQVAGWSALDNYLDAASLFWNEWVINYDFAHQALLAQQVDHNSRELRMAAHLRFDQLRRRGARWAFRTETGLVQHKFAVVLGLLAASLLAYFFTAGGIPAANLRWRWAWKFSSLERPVNRHEAAHCYSQFLKIMRAKGFQKRPSQTPWEFARGVADSPVGPPAAEFTRAYNVLRFGSEPVSRAILRAIFDQISKA